MLKLKQKVWMRCVSVDPKSPLLYLRARPLPPAVQVKTSYGFGKVDQIVYGLTAKVGETGIKVISEEQTTE